MKKAIKFILIAFVVMLVCGILSVVLMLGVLDGPSTDKSGPADFTRNELTITLTKEFEYDFYYRGYGNETIYLSDKHIVGLYCTSIEERTRPGQEPPSLRTYASSFYPVWVGLKGVEAIELQEKDGLLYSEFDMNGDGNPDDICFFFETETSFYFVHMKCNKQASTYEESRDQFFAWAKTVKLAPVVQGE
jgi:hypothetical protein